MNLCISSTFLLEIASQGEGCTYAGCQGILIQGAGLMILTRLTLLLVAEAMLALTSWEEDVLMSPKTMSPAAKVRELIALDLNARHGKVPVQISAIIGHVRSKFPHHRLNDAELTHLIAEGAIRRGLDVNFDAGAEPMS
jgi:hypothetical protein